MMHRLRSIVTLAGLTVLLAATSGHAIFTPGSPTAGPARTHATTLHGPATAQASRIGTHTVAISWSVATLGNGASIGHYVVSRSLTGEPSTLVPAGGTCTGQVHASSCQDTSVAAGTWVYQVTARVGTHWRGTPALTQPISVTGTTSMTLAPTMLGANAYSGGSTATIEAAITGFGAEEPISIHLDAPGGPVLTATPAMADGSGTASLAVTVPHIADGTHTLFAVGGIDSQASSIFTSDVTAPTGAVTSPTAGALAADLQQVSATASDATSGVASVRFELRPSNSPTWTTIALDSTAPYSTTIDSTVLSEGPYLLRIIVTDVAGNTYARPEQLLYVDRTAPWATDVQALNTGINTIGQPDPGDLLVLTWSEPMLASSIIAGWSGAPIAVTIRFVQSGSADLVQLWTSSGTQQLPVGTINLDANKVNSTTTFLATLQLNGAAATTTIGALSGLDGRDGTHNSNTGTMTWTPSTTPTDLVGRHALATAATESGALDKDF